MKLIEVVRSQAVLHERSKINSWEDRRRVLLGNLPKSKNELSPTALVSLGSVLSKTFQLPHLMNKRGQSELSGGGSVWTSLVNYYFNLCLAGTDAIAVSGRFIPSSVREALKVTHASSASTKLNSDIDIVVVNVPGISREDIDPGKNALTRFFKEAELNFKSSSAIVVQTKTNWNDNSQVPMLWNLIYKLARQGSMPENGVAVGSGAFHIKELKGFGYAFGTVPTQKDLAKIFKPNSTAVVRVRSLTCGSYWGHPSQPGIMSSLAEFFSRAYNQTHHCFPPPTTIGGGYTKAIVAPSDAVDVKAFDLYR